MGVLQNMRKSNIYRLTCSFINILKLHILGFIWDVIVWCFDALAWLIRNIGNLYHWVIRSISDVYHWFMELNMLYQILIGVTLVVLFGGWAVYSRKRAEEQARKRALLDEEWARQRALEEEEEEVYRIVTSIRGQSLEGRISNQSPLGKALMGKRVGEEVEVFLEGGSSYTVLIRSIEKTGEKEEEEKRKI